MSDYRRNLAFKAGYNAWKRGLAITRNNRERGTIYYDDWCDGFRHAEQGN